MGLLLKEGENVRSSTRDGICVNVHSGGMGGVLSP